MRLNELGPAVIFIEALDTEIFDEATAIDSGQDMREDIDRERKFMTKAWAKREAQVSVMIESAIGMVGDLHGIMGQAMPEIAAIDEPPMLEGKAA
jgi:hypothetical protein